MYPQRAVSWRGGGDGVREISVEVRPFFNDVGGSNFFNHVDLYLEKSGQFGKYSVGDIWMRRRIVGGNTA